MLKKSAGLIISPFNSRIFQSSLQVMLIFAVLLALVVSVMSFQPARATGSLTITPITWNVIGLDSNLVTVGPNKFPIGARVCNTSGSDSTVSVTFNWDDGLNKYTGNAYINLRQGTLDVVSLSIPAGQCKDAYFEVEVTRDSIRHITRLGVIPSQRMIPLFPLRPPPLVNSLWSTSSPSPATRPPMSS